MEKVLFWLLELAFIIFWFIAQFFVVVFAIILTLFRFPVGTEMNFENIVQAVKGSMFVVQNQEPVMYLIAFVIFIIGVGIGETMEKATSKIAEHNESLIKQNSRLRVTLEKITEILENAEHNEALIEQNRRLQETLEEMTEVLRNMKRA